MDAPFGCPSCGHVMSIPAHRAGTRLYCTQCNTEFTAPENPDGADVSSVCIQCGRTLEPETRFCGHCGAVTGDGPSAEELFKRPAIITLLAVLNALGGVVLLPLGAIVFVGGLAEGEPGGAVLAFIYLVLGASQLACAIGLWKLRPWGRGLQIALSTFGLLGIPLGTIISILILVYLFKPEIKLLFSGVSPEMLSQQDISLLARASKSAASLVTVIVVVFVLIFLCGIISAIAIPNLLNAINRARQKRTVADIRTIATASEAYAVDQRHYPVGATSIADLEEVLTPTYVVQLPSTDGWREAIQIRTGDDGTWYEIASNGRDKHPGARPGGPTVHFDCDIVYRNGSFVQWPEGIQVD